MLLIDVTLHQVWFHGMKSFISAACNVVAVKVICVNRFLGYVVLRGCSVINHKLSL